MSLNDIQEFIFGSKKRLALLGSGLVAGLAVLVGIFLLLFPPVPEESKLPAFTLSAQTGEIIGSVDLSKLSLPSFPNQINAYKVEGGLASFDESQAAQLAARFGFTTAPRKTTDVNGVDFFVFVKGEQSLSVTSIPRSLLYTDEVSIEEGAVYEGEAAFEGAREFLTSRGLSLEGLFPSELNYFTATGPTDEPSQADFLSASLVWEVGGREVLGERPTQKAATVFLDRSNRVNYLNFNYLDSKFTEPRLVNLIPIKDAAARLAVDGYVVFAQQVSGSQLDTSGVHDLLSFSPDKVDLIYVQPDGSATLYPVYLFNGKGTSAVGDVEAAVYVLAVSPDYIKK